MKAIKGWTFLCAALALAFGARATVAATAEEGPAAALGEMQAKAAALSVGRIYKLTGAPFVGNRLVLRAKVYGSLSGAKYSWKRDGVQVSTAERLDIASLGAGDFGTYTLTVTAGGKSATSGGYVLAEAPRGVPVGWGAEDHGRTEAPAGESGFVQVASGMNFNLGLKADGTVRAWGYNGHGGCDVPEGLSGVSSVAAGGYGSAGAGFAVKTDGRVEGWGQAWFSETYWDDYAHADWDEEAGDWIYTGDWVTYSDGVDLVGLMPADLSDVVQVAVGSPFAMALKADGTVETWGEGEAWRYDDNMEEWVQYDAYAPPEGLSDVVAIAAGAHFAVALTADGSLTAWGNEDDGEYFGYLPAPASLTDVLAVAANKCGWSGSAGFALQAGGTVAKWGDEYGYTGYESGSATDAAAIDAGQYFFVARKSDGTVTVWDEYNDYGICDVPAAVQGNAFAVAAGGYHCTALLADTDGDSIADAEEAALGRDPSTWEPWERTTAGGTVTVDGKAAEYGVELCLLDAEGTVRGWAETDETGAWSMEGIVPGVYVLQLSAPDAVDTEMSVSTLAGAASLPIDLVPGQAPAPADVVAHEAAESGNCGESCTPVDLPEGTTVYLNLWPAGMDENGLLDLGEVAASHSVIDGTIRLPHWVTVKRPGTGAQIPVPDRVAGIEGATLEAHPHFTKGSGAVRVTTVPAGAEVWVDYADESLGVTPLTVTGLAATTAASHGHILLLKKDGYLRPRPIEFSVEAGTTTQIALELESAENKGLSVSVDGSVAGLDIYLDYLPTGLATPATVQGLGTDEYWEERWHSASHSILLKGDGMRSIAPRMVEAEPVFDGETGEWTWPAETEMHIVPATLLKCQQVTFDANGGTCGTQEKTVETGWKYGALPLAERAGYEHLGWFTAKSGGQQVTAESQVTQEDERTLWAHWKAKTYRVTLDEQGGHGGTTNVTATYAKAMPAITVPSRPGYAFGGYYSAKNGGGTKYYTETGASARTWNKTAAATLYAKWTANDFTVTLDPQGGTGGTPSVTAEFGEAMPPIEVPAKEGVEFAGYFSGQGGTGTRYYTATGESSKAWDGAGAATLFAHWVEPKMVWRFYSDATRGHFFTISESEKDKLVATSKTWQFEGGAYRAYTSQVAGTVPLYRFWSDGMRGHFFTVSESEKNRLVATSKTWQFEGVAYYVYPAEAEGSVAVYRFWSDAVQHHFYTVSESERDRLRQGKTWAYEGIAFWALPREESPNPPEEPEEPQDPQAELQTVWRFYSDATQGHFFTISESEKNRLVATSKTWQFEGGAYRAYTGAAEGTVPLYRFWSDRMQGHFFTISESEKNRLVATSKTWQYEGIAYYVYPAETEGSVAVYRFWSDAVQHHFYTVSESERDRLRQGKTWSYEGIAFWAFPQVQAKGMRKAQSAAAPEQEIIEESAGKETAGHRGVIVTTSDGSDGSAVADGDVETGWTPDGTGWAWVILTLPEPLEVASVEVSGENLPETLRVLLSEDAEEWYEDEGILARYVWVAWEGAKAVLREVLVNGGE